MLKNGEVASESLPRSHNFICFVSGAFVGDMVSGGNDVELSEFTCSTVLDSEAGDALASRFAVVFGPAREMRWQSDVNVFIFKITEFSENPVEKKL